MIVAGGITLVAYAKCILNTKRMDNKKPEEMARYIFNNCVYFCGSKLFAKECTLYIVSIILRLKLKVMANLGINYNDSDLQITVKRFKFKAPK